MVEITHEFMAGGRLRFTAVCEEEALGLCDCRFDDNNVVIERISGDIAVTDALIRAALNYAVRHGVDKAGFDLSPAEYHVLNKACPAVDPKKGVESIVAFFSAKSCG